MLLGAVVFAGIGTPATPSNGRIDQFIFHLPSSFPDATNTGVPAGTSLTAYSGPNPITTNNTIIDGKTFTICPEIRAQNVTIKNSRISVTDGDNACSGAYAVSLYDGDATFNNWSLTIQDSEIDCGGDPPNGYDNSTALGSAFITARRLKIHGCENGGDIDQSFDIQDSYLYDFRQCTPADGCGGDGSHTDGFQFAGHFSPAGSTNVVNFSLNVTIKHNTVFVMKAGAHTPESNEAYYTNSAIITHPLSLGRDQNVAIENNLFAGGGYTLYCPTNTTFNNGHVTGNHFSNRYNSKVGFFAPTTECEDETFTGNVCHESGAALTATTGSC
jgi:hypothetical protein